MPTQQGLDPEIVKLSEQISELIISRITNEKIIQQLEAIYDKDPDKFRLAVNSKAGDSLTPLKAAILFDQQNIFEYLLQNGAELTNSDIESLKNHSPGIKAIAAGHLIKNQLSSYKAIQFDDPAMKTQIGAELRFVVSCFNEYATTPSTTDDTSNIDEKQRWKFIERFLPIAEIIVIKNIQNEDYANFDKAIEVFCSPRNDVQELIDNSQIKIFELILSLGSRARNENLTASDLTHARAIYNRAMPYMHEFFLGENLRRAFENGSDTAKNRQLIYGALYEFTKLHLTKQHSQQEVNSALILAINFEFEELVKPYIKNSKSTIDVIKLIDAAFSNDLNNTTENKVIGSKYTGYLNALLAYGFVDIYCDEISNRCRQQTISEPETEAIRESLGKLILQLNTLKSKTDNSNKDQKQYDVLQLIFNTYYQQANRTSSSEQILRMTSSSLLQHQIASGAKNVGQSLLAYILSGSTDNPSSIYKIPFPDNLKRALESTFNNNSNNTIQLKYNLFKRCLKYNPQEMLDYRFEIANRNDSNQKNLTSLDKDYCQFVTQNFGLMIQAAIALKENSSQTEIDDHNNNQVADLIKFYKTTSDSKIKCRAVIPYITNTTQLESIIKSGIVELPSKNITTGEDDIIDTLDNPITIAAREHKIDMIKHAYDNRDLEPWAAYWRQAGDQDNALLRCLILQPTTPEINIKHLLQYILNIDSVSKHISAQTKDDLYKIVADLQSDFFNPPMHLNQIVSNYNFVMKTINPVLYRAPNIASWWDEYLRLDRFRSSDNKLIIHGEAHNDQVAKIALEISGHDFKPLLNRTYAEYATETEKVKQALIDARILLIKVYLEDEPIGNSENFMFWNKLVDTFDMRTYVTSSKQSRRVLSFQEFKNEFIKNKQNLAFVSGIEPDSQHIKALTELLLRNETDTEYIRELKISWQAFDPYQHKHGSLDQDKPRNFVLFNQMLATEPLSSVVDNITNVKDLYTLIRTSLAPIARDIKEKLAHILNHNNNDFDINKIREQVKKCLLEDQQLMALTFKRGAYEIMADGGYTGGISCPTGVITRFAARILGTHYKYSSLDNREYLIKEYMQRKFTEYLQKQIVKILIGRLTAKYIKPGIAAPFNYLFTFSLRRTVPTVDTKIIHFTRSLQSRRIKSLAELKSKIQALDLPVKRLVLATMFDLNESTKEKSISDDQDLAKIFNTVFSVSTDNFRDLFTKDMTIPKFTAILNNDDLTNPDNRIIRDEFDKIYNRSEFLSKAYNVSPYSFVVFTKIENEVTSWLKKADPLAPPLNDFEKQLIRYTIVSIAERPAMNEMASTISASLTKIQTMYADTFKEDITIENQIRNHACRTFISLFEELLTSDDELTGVGLAKFKNAIANAILENFNSSTSNKEDQLDINALNSKLKQMNYRSVQEICRDLYEQLAATANIVKNSSGDELARTEQILDDLCHSENFASFIQILESESVVNPDLIYSLRLVSDSNKLKTGISHFGLL